jgi:hypothetical protein
MALVQLFGYAAFILASMILGTRLIRLWQRSREWPELVIGASFWLAGALGYIAWLAIAVLIGKSAAPETIQAVAGAGLTCMVAGAISNGVGTLLVFRPGARWAVAWVATVGIAMSASLIAYAMSPAEESRPLFWRTIALALPLYTWGAAEAIVLSVMLHRRARLGLVDPMVANRTMQFGISGAAVVVSIAISYLSQLYYGGAPPPVIPTAAAAMLMVGAGSIWFGFFPPAFYRDRIERKLGVN